MPHMARRISKSGFYHVVPKGNNDQILFESDADRRLYISLLSKAAKEYSILIHAYCLMSNHVHLVLEDADGSLSDFMKLVHERYGMYLSEKTGRRGGIFRTPFWSEPIDTDAHLLCAVRYVHANPAAAGICAASQYEWSSVKDYLGRTGITYTNLVFSVCGGRDGFIRFSASSNATAHPFPGSRLKRHLSEDETVRIAREILGDVTEKLGSVDCNERSRAVKLLEERGLSAAQISRVTGLSRGEVRAVSGNNQKGATP